MGYSSMLPGLCKLGFASNSANPFSTASVVLGGVTMGFLVARSLKSLIETARGYEGVILVLAR